MFPDGARSYTMLGGKELVAGKTCQGFAGAGQQQCMSAMPGRWLCCGSAGDEAGETITKERSVFGVSSGERRRVALALALGFGDVAAQRGRMICNLLVLDEVQSPANWRMICLHVWEAGSEATQ